MREYKIIYSLISSPRLKIVDFIIASSAEDARKRFAEMEVGIIIDSIERSTRQ